MPPDLIGRRRESAVEADREHGAAVAKRLDAAGDRAQLVGLDAHRLLDEDVLAGSQCANHEICMQIVAREHEDDRRVGIRQHLVGIGRREGEAGLAAEMFGAHAFARAEPAQRQTARGLQLRQHDEPRKAACADHAHAADSCRRCGRRLVRQRQPPAQHRRGRAVVIDSTK